MQKHNLHLKRCSLCGADHTLWTENPHDGTIVADYVCSCNVERRQEYASAYARDYYIRQGYLRFLKSLDAKDRRYFDAPVTPTPGNVEAVSAAAAFQPPKFVYLYGDPGLGKTHLAILAARGALLAGKAVRFISESDLIDERRAAMFLDRALEALPQALLLDDIGKKGKPGDFYASLMHDLLEQCDRKDVGVFITSNHSPEEAARRIALDEQNARAIQSRLELGKVIHIHGESRREGSKA